MLIRTPTMQRLEAKYGKPIEELLVEMHHIQRRSLSEIAAEFGITHAAVSAWMQRCGIPVRRVSVSERPPANFPQRKSAP